MTSTTHDDAGSETADLETGQLYVSGYGGFPSGLHEQPEREGRKFAVIQLDEQRDAVTLEGKDGETTTVSYDFLTDRIEEGSVILLEEGGQ